MGIEYYTEIQALMGYRFKISQSKKICNRINKFLQIKTIFSNLKF